MSQNIYGKILVLSVLVSVLVVPQAFGVNTTINGSLGDLDGNGDGGAGEDAVAAAAVACWDSRITTNRNFSLTFNLMSLSGGTLANGAHDTLDGNDIPTSGTINVDNDGSTSWTVDSTPLDSSEFTPDPNSQWLFTNGPAGADLMAAIMHETGHALGWVCGDSCGRNNPDNPRFDALMNPDKNNFVAGPSCASPFPIAGQPAKAGCVHLQWNPFDVALRGDGLGGSGSSTVNELSHPGVGDDLMEGFLSGGERETPSVDDVDMFMHAYGDTVNFPPTVNAGTDVLSECNAVGGSNVTLDGASSSDPDGDTLTYDWTCPNISSGADTATPSGFFLNGQTVTCRMDAGDLATCNPDADTVDVTVVDTTAPDLTCPTDITVECTAQGGNAASDLEIAAFLNGAMATDVCDANLPIGNDAGAFFNLGQTPVKFMTQDDSTNSSMCTANVTVEDTTPPDIVCNAPGTIVPADAPISFTATATDICSATTLAITNFSCFAPKKNGKVIDKSESCIVTLSGDTINIVNSGGVGDHIAWNVDAQDANGNSASQSCEIVVVNPNK